VASSTKTYTKTTSTHKDEAIFMPILSIDAVNGTFTINATDNKGTVYSNLASLQSASMNEQLYLQYSNINTTLQKSENYYVPYSHGEASGDTTDKMVFTIIGNLGILNETAGDTYYYEFILSGNDPTTWVTGTITKNKIELGDISYTAGTGINIDANNVISNTDGILFETINGAYGPVDFPRGIHYYVVGGGGASFRIRVGDSRYIDFGAKSAICCYNFTADPDEPYITFIVVSDYGYKMFTYNGSNVTNTTIFTDESPVDAIDLNLRINVVDSVTNNEQLFNSSATIVKSPITITYTDTQTSQSTTFTFPANSLIIGD
jgi:hypothetical protein